MGEKYGDEADTCFVCDREIKTLWVIVDRNGEDFGRYCSKRCADEDAVGPRLRPYRVERVARSSARGLSE